MGRQELAKAIADGRMQVTQIGEGVYVVRSGVNAVKQKKCLHHEVTAVCDECGACPVACGKSY